MYWEPRIVLCKYSPQNIRNFPFIRFCKSFWSVMWIFFWIWIYRESRVLFLWKKIRIKDLSFLVISRTLKKWWVFMKELAFWTGKFMTDYLNFFLSRNREVWLYTIISHLSSWEPWLWILRTVSITAKESGVSVPVSNFPNDHLTLRSFCHRYHSTRADSTHVCQLIN